MLRERSLLIRGATDDGKILTREHHVPHYFPRFVR